MQESSETDSKHSHDASCEGLTYHLAHLESAFPRKAVVRLITQSKCSDEPSFGKLETLQLPNTTLNKSKQQFGLALLFSLSQNWSMVQSWMTIRNCSKETWCMLYTCCDSWFFFYVISHSVFLSHGSFNSHRVIIFVTKSWSQFVNWFPQMRIVLTRVRN